MAILGTDGKPTSLHTDAQGRLLVTQAAPPAFATAQAPAYAKGLWYFDTTLNKLRVGGASGWETVTSS